MICLWTFICISQSNKSTQARGDSIFCQMCQLKPEGGLFPFQQLVVNSNQKRHYRLFDLRPGQLILPILRAPNQGAVTSSTPLIILTLINQYYLYLIISQLTGGDWHTISTQKQIDIDDDLSYQCQTPEYLDIKYTKFEYLILMVHSVPSHDF